MLVIQNPEANTDITRSRHVAISHFTLLPELLVNLKTKLLPHIHGWSENFSASTINGNTLGKIFFSYVGTSVKSIHVKLKGILSSSLFIQLSGAGVLSLSLKMDKIKYRAVIKFFVKEGLTPNEIHSKFIKVYWDSSPSFSTIKK